MTLLLSREICNVKFKQIPNFDPRALGQLLKSVCGGNKARHKLILVNLVFFPKHCLKISSPLQLSWDVRFGLSFLLVCRADVENSS